MNQPVNQGLLSAAFGANDPYVQDAAQQYGIAPTNLPMATITKANGGNGSNGILGNGTTNTGILNNQMVTGQRRNMVPGAIQMPQMPDNKIGMGDMLIRMGGAGMEGAQQSGLQSYANMAREYGNVQDINNSASIDAYNAQVKALQAQNKAAQNQPKAPHSSPYMQAAIDAIDQIEANLAMAESNNNPFDNVTGFIGNSLSFIAGTPAHDTKMAIETVVSSIGFDRLQKMRDDSPTGGALGQVSERELAQLNASLGNLRQSQSREQFKANLALVKKHYISAVKAIEAQQQAYAAMNGMAAPVGTMSPNVSAADAIVGVTN